MRIFDMEIFRITLYESLQKLYDACLCKNTYKMFKYSIFTFEKIFSIALDTLLLYALVVVFFKNYHWINERICKSNINKVKKEEQKSINEIQISTRKITIKKIVILMALSVIYIPLLLMVLLIILDTCGLV